MFLALGLAYEVAVFHVSHAFFKACLFGSGSVIHALHGEQDMRMGI
jgi:NADH-quinone oxidoreductase subunit L